MEEVGKSAARAGEQASRSFKQSGRDAKDYLNTLREIQRLQRQMGGGAGGGVDGGAGGGLPPVGIPPIGSGREKRGAIARYFSNGRGAGMAGAMGGLAAGMLSGGDGGMWSMAGRAGGSIAGATAGMMTGKPMVGGIVGAFASQLLGGIGSAIDRHISNVLRESETYTDLRHSLGATSVEFDSLRDSLRHFADGLDITYGEMGNLAKMFTHVAGLKDASGLGGDISGAVGFARGYGIAPEQSAQFFALMRHNGVTANEQDSRRLALMIADSVAKGGTSAKMDEVLNAISSFASSQARASLTAPNIGNYADLLSGMTGLGLPGLKSPGDAAAVIAAANAAAQQGGGFGDPSRSMKLGIYQKYGFTAFDMNMVNAQGATGTLRDMLDSSIRQAEVFAGRSGNNAELTRLLGIKGRISDSELDKPMIARAMEEAFAGSGGNFHKFRQMISLDNNLSEPQAMALWEAMGKDGGSGLFSKLKAAGVDPNTVKSKDFHALAALAGGDDAMLRKQAEKLGKMKLSAEDDKILKAALGTGGDDLRNAVLRLTNTYDKQLDAGEIARQQQASMEKSLDKLATELVPATQTIKDGILALVQTLAPDTQVGKRAKAKEASESAYLDIVEGRFNPDKAGTGPIEREAMRRRIKEQNEAWDKRIMAGEQFQTPAMREYAEKRRAEMAAAGQSVAPMQAPAGGNLDESGRKRRGDKPSGKLTEQELAYLGETDRLLGAKPGTSASQIAIESGNNPDAVSPRGAWGLGQIMPKERRVMEARMGRKIETRMDQLEAHRLMMLENKGRFGTVDAALTAYNGGWNTEKWGSTTENAQYVEKIKRGIGDDKLPRNASLSQDQQQGGKFSLSGEFVLRDPNGFSLADPIIITQNMAPQPAGR